MLNLWTVKNNKNEINLNSIGASETETMVKWMTLNKLYEYNEGDGDFRIRDAFAKHSKRYGVKLTKLVVYEAKA